MDDIIKKQLIEKLLAVAKKKSEFHIKRVKMLYLLYAVK